jgi:hypothetical protein
VVYSEHEMSHPGSGHVDTEKQCGKKTDITPQTMTLSFDMASLSHIDDNSKIKSKFGHFLILQNSKSL